MTFLYAIVLLGILIFVHELGHFLAAKLVGVRVLRFSLGFGPGILRKKFGDTEYLISLIPLGGYVKMLGESRENGLRAEEKAFAYNSKPVWKRLIIVLSGPLYNMIFAVIIFVFVFLYGLPVLLSEVGEILHGSPAEKAGLMKGDRIIAVDSSRATQWDEMRKIIHGSPEKKLTITIQRKGETLTMSIVPERKKVKNLFGEEKEIGLIGIKPSGSSRIKKEGIIGAVIKAIERTWEISVLTIVSVIKLIQRAIPAETIGGPILIIQMAGEQASLGFLNFFVFMAVININLGILNLLPIPILDGGNIMFLGIEAIRRKPLSGRVVAVAQGIGLVIILSITAFALYNDLIRFITNRPLP